MNLANGILCSDCDWPSPTGVVFQTITATFELASYFFTMLYKGAFSPSVTTMSAWISLGRKEGNVLFNYALFYYLRLYGVRHMVKHYSDSEKGNPLPPYRLLFPINSNVSFICIIPPSHRIAHTTAFVTPVVEHWLEREIAQWVHHEGSIRRPIAP